VTAPLLAFERPRFAGSDIVLGTLDAAGPRLALVGAWAPLFGLFAGRVELVSGSVRVFGIEVPDAVRQGQLALALADAPLPPTWTVGEVLRHGAALSGVPYRVAAEQAKETASDMGLGELLSKPLSRLRPGQQRAAAIALACVGEPRALAIEEPFARLEPSEQRYVAGVLERALRDRPGLFSVVGLPSGTELDAFVEGSDELLYLGLEGLVARGGPKELMSAVTTYRVVVLRHADALLNRLSKAGYEVRRMLADEMAALMVRDPRGLGAEPLLEAALGADSPVIELVPFPPGTATAAAPADVSSTT
jgi:ABC-type multidrug transport system ATPase subunit